jgi:hypothetical protein
MTVAKLSAGIRDMMKVKKEIDTEDQVEGPAKVVKLRFTAKQFDAFREACTVFKLLSSDDKFPDYVKSVLGTDIKAPTIDKQLVQPIVNAPLKIPMKLHRAQKGGEEKEKKETYFTRPIPVTPEYKALHKAVAAKDDDLNLRMNIGDGTTCVTDVRVMVGKYIAMEGLRGNDGITIDDLLHKLASRSLKDNSDCVHIIDNSYVIPKGDRKVMQGIINDVAFGKNRK